MGVAVDDLQVGISPSTGAGAGGGSESTNVVGNSSQSDFRAGSLRYIGRAGKQCPQGVFLGLVLLSVREQLLDRSVRLGTWWDLGPCSKDGGGGAEATNSCTRSGRLGLAGR